MVVLATVRHRLGSRLQNAGLDVRWEIEDLPPMPWLGPSQALQVMRIVQEALVNALKHAGASTVRLSTRRVQGQSGAAQVAVIIQDDGVGFERTLEVDGRGLKHMALRAQQLRAELKIDSSSEDGTTITLLLPIEQPGLVSEAS
jgi:signal transduction histidine kinase